MVFTQKAAFLLVAVAVTASLLLTGCRRTTSVPPEPTPVQSSTPPVGITQLVPDTHQNPYRQLAPGLLARTVYKAEPSNGLEVEIWDLLVGPGKKSETASVPGAAVFEVRSGSGLVIAGEKRHEVKIGATLSLDDGNSFRIENGSAEDALSIRAVIIRGAQK